MSADIIVRGDCNDCACNFYHDCAAAQSNGSSTSNFIPMCVCGHTISQHPVLRALSRNTVTGELQVIFTATTTIVPPTCVNCESNNFKSLSTSALVAKPTPLRSVKSTQSRPNSRRDALKTPTGEVTSSSTSNTAERKKATFNQGIFLLDCNADKVPEKGSSTYKELENRGLVSATPVSLNNGMCLETKLREHFPALNALHELCSATDAVLYDFVRKQDGNSYLDQNSQSLYNSRQYPHSVSELMCACNAKCVVMKLRPAFSNFRHPQDLPLGTHIISPNNDMINNTNETAASIADDAELGGGEDFDLDCELFDYVCDDIAASNVTGEPALGFQY